MFIKKRASSGETNGVSYLNGEVKVNGYTLNVYCFVTDGILIDTGAHSLHKYFELFIQKSDFDQVMITHHHEDHTGCAAYIEKMMNRPIYINEKSVSLCQKRASYPLYRQLFWGRRKPFHPKPLSNSFTSRTSTWDVIDTPGHAFDHLAFLNRQTGQLFTGDLFIHERTKVILAEESIPQLTESLTKILSYDFEDVFCNHAGFIQMGRETLQQKRDFLVSLQQEILHLHTKGLTPEAICKQLFPKKYPIIRISNGEYHTMHIVTSILSEKNIYHH